MKALRRFLVRLAGHFTRQRDEQRLREELENHLTLQTAENVTAGMAPDEARRHAILKFGAVEALKEDYRDTRTLLVVEEIFRDMRYALRVLERIRASLLWW